MHISDWSSDVCSSDLPYPIDFKTHSKRTSIENPKVFVMMSVPADFSIRQRFLKVLLSETGLQLHVPRHYGLSARLANAADSASDRKSGASGKCVSVRVDLVVRRIITQQKTTEVSH